VLSVVQLRPDNRFVEGYYDGREVVRERLTRGVYWPLSLLLAVVDPQAEADLVGLDAAVTAGRYLSMVGPQCSAMRREGTSPSSRRRRRRSHRGSVDPGHGGREQLAALLTTGVGAAAVNSITDVPVDLPPTIPVPEPAPSLPRLRRHSV